MNKLPVSQSTKGRRLLTIKQVESICGVTRRTVYNWMDASRVQWAQGLTRRYVYADSIPLIEDFQVTEESFS